MSDFPELQIVATGLHFAEGPVLLPNGDILVCETHGPGLERITPGGVKSTFAAFGGGANGAATGPDGAIYVCNNGGGRVVFEQGPDGELVGRPPRPGENVRKPGRIQRVTDGGEATDIYLECDGRALMSPNDIVFDRNGNFYFTDYGFYSGEIREAGLDRAGENGKIYRTLGMVMRSPAGSVYYASPDGKMIREVIHPMAGANGVGLSPDERTLYVAESVTARLWAFDLPEPGVVGERRCLGTLPFGGPANIVVADSMVIDGDGNIIVGTVLNGGLTIFSPDGSSIRHVPTGDIYTTNACFGGPNMRTLYVALGEQGALGKFEGWPSRGLDLNFTGTADPGH
jgi:gluconolactonase